MPVKITGFEETKASLRQYARDLADEKAIRLVLREAVVPLLYRIRQNLRPHRKSGLTEADIDIWNRPTEAGVVRVVVSGTKRKKEGRGFIIRFVELGTAHNRAFPFMRPAWDAEKGLLTARIAAGLKRRLGPGWAVRKG